MKGHEHGPSRWYDQAGAGLAGSNGPVKEQAAQENNPIINLVSQGCDAEGVRVEEGVQISPTSMDKKV
jgi:hypothetical protein